MDLVGFSFFHFSEDSVINNNMNNQLKSLFNLLKLIKRKPG